MSDAFVSLIAIQPTAPKTSQAGSTSTTEHASQPKPSAGIYASIRSIGVKTK